MNAFDIETFIDEKNQFIPYCICYIYNNKKKSFYFKENTNIIQESLISIINEKQKKKKNIFYIHNLNFDGLIILDYLTASDLKYEVFIRKMQIYSIKIFVKSYIIEFKCSFKLLPSSLNKIAKSFNLDLKMGFPYKFVSEKTLFYSGKVPNEIYFNNKEDYIKCIEKLKNKEFNMLEYTIDYCTRDVEITSQFVKILNSLISKYNVSIENIYSAPSLSLKIFIKNYNKDLVSFKYNNLIYNFIKNAYYGGKCEVYGNSEENEYIYYYDFSGMYAQCMLEKFPYGKYNFSNNIKDISIPGYYCIEFESKMEYPILGHHHYKSKKLLFTNGKMTGFYWYEEILEFINNGGILHKIIYAITFEKYENIFENFVYDFNAIRSKGMEYKTFAKLIINSLYGRLGMSNEKEYSFFCSKENINFYEKRFKVLKKIELNNACLFSIDINNLSKENINFFKIKKNKSNIAIAAAITSKARIKLFRAQKDVIFNGGRLLYSDTDSIFAAYKKKIDNEKHGLVEWGAHLIEDAVFALPKAYAILYHNNIEEIKIKGLNQKNISFYDFKEKFYEDKTIKINFFSFIEKSKLKLKMNTIDKNFELSSYNKRLFYQNKKKTRPLLYVNDEYI